jgi:hypothetical protein
MPQHPKFTCVNSGYGYQDFEASLMTVGDLWLDIRITIPDAILPGDEPAAYFAIHAGDENDAFAHHPGEPESFYITRAQARAALLACGVPEIEIMWHPAPPAPQAEPSYWAPKSQVNFGVR